MPDLKKFEDTERKIAKSENVLLEHGKFVAVDWAEDDMYHLEEHEKGSDNMITKMHIKNHIRNAEAKAREKLEENDIEASMPF